MSAGRGCAAQEAGDRGAGAFACPTVQIKPNIKSLSRVPACSSSERRQRLAGRRFYKVMLLSRTSTAHGTTHEEAARNRFSSFFFVLVLCYFGLSAKVTTRCLIICAQGNTSSASMTIQENARAAISVNSNYRFCRSSPRRSPLEEDCRQGTC